MQETPNMEVEFTLEDDTIVLRKASTQKSRAQLAVERIKGARTRSTLNTDEILALTRGT